MSNIITDIIYAQVTLDRPSLDLEGLPSPECSLEGMIYSYYRNQVGLDVFEASNYTTAYILALSRKFDQMEVA